MDSWPEDAPAPRLCHLVRWPDFSGYGFNLRCARSNPSQFVSEVDDGSPAHLGGLRKGDRIVEVNGVNVNNENHYQVVERIKQNPGEVKLLVVDEDTDKWYKQRDLSVHPPTSGQPNVIRIKTPTPRPKQADAKPVEMASVSPVSLGAMDSSLEQANAADDEDEHSIEQQQQQSVIRVKSPPMSPDSGKGDEEPHAASNGTGNGGRDSTIEAEISHHRKSTDSIKFSSISNNQLVADSASNSTNVSLSASPVNGDRSSKLSHTKTKHRDGVDSGQSSSRDSSSISNESITDSLDEVQSAQRFVKDQIEKSLTEHQEISRSNSIPEQNDNRTHIEVKTRPPTSQKPSNIMVARIREQLSKEGEINKIPDEVTPIADNNDDINTSNSNTKKLNETKLADNNNWNSISNLEEQTETRKKINTNNNDFGGLNLNMSASEMRELLARRKKVDPKKAQMNIRQKYEMIQRM